MSDKPQLPDRKEAGHVWGRLPGASLFVRVNLVAILVTLAGLFLPRVSAGGYGLATLQTGYGQVFGLVLLVACVTVACWSLAGGDRLTTLLLFVVWLGLLALATFEMVKVSATVGDHFGLVDVGLGLYCNVVGAAIGTLAALLKTMGQRAVASWGETAGDAGRIGDGRGERWLPWAWIASAGAVVLTLAAVAVSAQLAGRGDLARTAAGGFGPRLSFSVGAPGSHSGPTDDGPVEGHRVVTLPSTTSAASSAGTPTAAGGSASTGGTGTGDTGNSGAWDMGIGLSDYWPGYTGAPGSFYIWPGYLGPATNSGDTGGSGTGVTGSSGSGTGVTGVTGTTTTAPAAGGSGAVGSGSGSGVSGSGSGAVGGNSAVSSTTVPTGTPGG